MILDFDPGDKVVNPLNKEWGIGQVQSIINEKVTVNFENVGKKVINAKVIILKKTMLLSFLPPLLMMFVPRQKHFLVL